MGNTYTQMHIHAVFAVKFRNSLIHSSWEQTLYKYITGIVQNHGHKMLCINGMPDHIHMFFGFRPTQSLSDLMRIVKGDSSEWINKQRFTNATFRWQEGYGGFAYAPVQILDVCSYIENQKQHHEKKSFSEEYIQLLKEFKIDYDEKYIFKSPE